MNTHTHIYTHILAYTYIHMYPCMAPLIECDDLISGAMCTPIKYGVPTKDMDELGLKYQIPPPPPSLPENALVRGNRYGAVSVGCALHICLCIYLRLCICVIITVGRCTCSVMVSCMLFPMVIRSSPWASTSVTSKPYQTTS
jgi:hypothetical protein